MGDGCERVQEKDQKIDVPLAELSPDLQVSSQRTVQERAYLKAEFVLQLLAGGSRGEQLVVGQTLFVVFGPLDQVALGVVVGQEGYSLLPFHRKGFAYHAASRLLLQDGRILSRCPNTLITRANRPTRSLSIKP